MLNIQKQSLFRFPRKETIFAKCIRLLPWASTHPLRHTLFAKHTAETMGLNVIAQSFLQWMMAEKVLTTTEAIKQYNQCVDNANGREASKLRDSDGLEHQVGKINSYVSQSVYIPFSLPA